MIKAQDIKIDNSDIKPPYTSCFTEMFLKFGFIIGLLLVLLQISRGSSFIFFTFIYNSTSNINRDVADKLKNLVTITQNNIIDRKLVSNQFIKRKEV